MWRVSGALMLVCLCAAVRAQGDFNQTLLVMGIEYSPWPDHWGVSGISSGLDSYAYPTAPLPPRQQRAIDILGLIERGDAPLTWVAHPNWKLEYGIGWQILNLLGVITETGNTWRPDAIGLLNTGVGPPWRLQVGIELATRYEEFATLDKMPAHLLEVDFHSRPSIWDHDCGRPRTVVWVQEDWRTLPAEEAKAALFRAVRLRQVIGTVGPSTLYSLTTDGTIMTLQLTGFMEHIQLWSSGPGEPLATWSNIAEASYDLAEVPSGVQSVFWFAYGDTLTGGGWDVWSCNRKKVFFTSPIVRSALPDGPFVNQYDPEQLQCLMPVSGLVHQHTNISCDGDPTFSLDDLMNGCSMLPGVDFVLVTEHNPPDFMHPFPEFVTAWDELPTTAIWSASPEDAVLDALRSVHPNPTTEGSKVSIRFELGKRSRVTLRAYDVHGRLAAAGFDGIRDAGAYEENLDLDGRPAGVYYLRLAVGGRTFERRITVLH